MIKLYEQERCFGDQLKHSSIESLYIMENTKMNKLTNYIHTSGSKDKSYVIEKYINDVLEHRQLGICHDNCGGYGYCARNGDMTSIWERLFYCELNEKWMVTNYRYNDEKRNDKKLPERFISTKRCRSCSLSSF